jgi:hypothetical protein
MPDEPASHTCGECARFKVPDSGCWHSEDIRQGLMDKNDQACDRFFQKAGAKEKPKKKQRRNSGVTETGSFEAIYYDNKPAFLVKNSSDFTVVESLEINGETVFPKEQGKHYPYSAYGFFKAQVAGREELFWKVRDEFQNYVDVEPSIWKDILAAFTLLSYQQEKLETCPYLYVYGDNESGKSTILKVLNALCYRPLYGECINAADIYGYLEDSDSIGTILEDEAQGVNKDLDKTKIYKSGYKKGSCIPRTLLLQHDRVIKYYNVFCLKSVASEQLPQQKGFRERFLEIGMTEGFPQKEFSDLTQDDVKRFHELRDMLLKWRMLSRDWQLPEVQLNVKGRIKELWKPLLQITHGLTVYNDLFKFVEEQRKERLSTKQDTLEGKIVKTVTDIFNESKSDSSSVPFQTIWSRLQQELDGKVDDKRPNAMDTSEYFLVTKNKIGYRLREVLSGRSKPVRHKDLEGNDVVIKAYEFDLNKLRRVAKKYGYEFVTKLPSEPSSRDTQASESMEKPFLDNGEKEGHTPDKLSSVSYLVTREKELPSQEEEPSISSKNSEEEKTVGKKDSNSVTESHKPQTPASLSNLATSSPSSFSVADVSQLTRLDKSENGECAACKEKKELQWNCILFDGSWGSLCLPCGESLQKELGRSRGG